MKGKVEPYTWKAIANMAAVALASIATELRGIRAVMERSDCSNDKERWR
jgi:hypothetical protein